MRRLLLACSLGALVFAGCFGRTGIGLDELESAGAPLDDAGDSGITIVDAAGDTTVLDTGPFKEDAPGVDRFIDIWDVIPIPEGGVIGECATCVRDKCGTQVNNCVNSPECRNGLACVATKCLTGGGTGGFDLACVNDCFKGDFKNAALAISTFTCVISGCGEKCGGFLGGLPGTGGASGFAGPGAGLPAGEMKLDVERLDPSTRFCFSIEAFAPWRNELEASACEQGLASCPR